VYLSRVRIDGIRGFRGDRAVDLRLTRPDGTHAGGGRPARPAWRVIPPRAFDVWPHCWDPA
jgi:hypothetical protein